MTKKEAYPLKLGNQWTYEVKQKTEGISYEGIHEVVEEKEFFGNIYYKIEGSGYSGWDYYRNTEDGKVEIVAYEEDTVEPMITGTIVVTPHETFDNGVLQGFDTEGNKITGSVRTNAVLDNSVINGFQATLRIETLYEWDNGAQFQKQVSFWGDGIGYIKSQTFVKQPDNEELQLLSEDLLIKTNFL